MRNRDAGGIVIATRAGAPPLMLIPLSRGGKHGDGRMKYALIDAADYPLIMARKWYAHWADSTRGFYADTNGQGKTILLHRIVLGLRSGDELEGDHRNRSGLDNRRSNLRIATPEQNSRNRGVRRTSESRLGVRGVRRAGKLWRARIGRHGATDLGRFPTQEAAASAYDRAARDLYGEFARTNGSA